MDRLVKKVGNIGAVPSKFDLDFIFEIDDKAREGLTDIFNLLDAYQDTGLTPEEIREYQNYGDCYADCPTKKELSNYKQSEEDGRLIELPCKPGDTVWCITSDQLDYICEPYECEVVHIDFDTDGIKLSINSKAREGGWGIPFKPDLELPSHMNIRVPSDFGKTVFLTREKAEKAL